MKSNLLKVNEALHPFIIYISNYYTYWNSIGKLLKTITNIIFY